MIEFEVLNIMPDAPAFNWAFTAIMVFVVVGVGFMLLLRVVSRS